MIPYMEISNSIAICSGSSIGSFVYDFFCPFSTSYIWYEKGADINPLGIGHLCIEKRLCSSKLVIETYVSYITLLV